MIYTHKNIWTFIINKIVNNNKIYNIWNLYRKNTFIQQYHGYFQCSDILYNLNWYNRYL